MISLSHPHQTTVTGAQTLSSRSNHPSKASPHPFELTSMWEAADTQIRRPLIDLSVWRRCTLQYALMILLPSPLSAGTPPCPSARWGLSRTPTCLKRRRGVGLPVASSATPIHPTLRHGNSGNIMSLKLSESSGCTYSRHISRRHANVFKLPSSRQFNWNHSTYVQQTVGMPLISCACFVYILSIYTYNLILQCHLNDVVDGEALEVDAVMMTVKASLD